MTNQSFASQNHSNNYSHDEIQKFDRLASRFWDPHAEFKTLHQINPLRTEFIEKNIEKNLNSLSNKTGLDIGCGGGILTESLAKKGALMTGIDLAPQAIQVAKLHLLESFKANLNINYLNISAEDFLNKNQNNLTQFDFITCLEMLEHVPDPEKIIRTISLLIKPHGLVFISTLNRNLRSFCEAILGAEYILKLIPKGTHTYEKFIKPEELTHMARSYGLNPINSAGIKYDLLRKTFSLENKIKTNYMICFKKI